MATYRRIVVPIDGSATSLRGLSEAIALAKRERARIFLVHVLDEFFVLAAPEAAVYSEKAIEDLQRGGRRVLERAEARVRAAGLQASTVMPETVGGRAADEIVRQAKKLKADLIVIGTHGRRGIKRLALGSDAEQVVRTAGVPVLVVRAAR
jgi:nucleotide-binding universal stress UspA family protein